MKALVLQHAMRGSLRAATWLLDRIGDLPTPKYRDSDQPWPSGSTQIIIKGGLPPTIINGAADAHEPDAAEEA